MLKVALGIIAVVALAAYLWSRAVRRDRAEQDRQKAKEKRSQERNEAERLRGEARALDHINRQAQVSRQSSSSRGNQSASSPHQSQPTSASSQPDSTTNMLLAANLFAHQDTGHRTSNESCETRSASNDSPRDDTSGCSTSYTSSGSDSYSAPSE